MTNYKLTQNSQDRTVIRLPNSFIPFSPANTDYANFKKAINEGTANLQDADGNVMAAEEAKAYVSTLP